MKRFFILAFLLVMIAPALAIQPGEALSDPGEESRARALMAELRCLVCQAESVEASPSPFAAEVRALVREQVAAGQSDVEIKQFLADRYGEEILYRPPFKPGTWLLWLGPFAVLGIGAVVALIVVGNARRNVQSADLNVDLSADEEARLAEALDKDSPPPA